MDGRANRVLYPSAVALIAFGTTAWKVSGEWPWDVAPSKESLEFLATAGIVTIGIGYLCNILFTLWMLSSETCRFIDFKELVSAFGFSYHENIRPESQQRLKELLLDEFHLRLHSHAPESLIAYCSRRNSGWYIANTSALASLIGWWVAIAVEFFPRTWAVTTSCTEVFCIAAWFILTLVFLMVCQWIWRECGTRRFSDWFWIPAIAASLLVMAAILAASDAWTGRGSCTEVLGVVTSFAIFGLAIPLVLDRQATAWNREYWGLCWKWIRQDRELYSLDPAWIYDVKGCLQQPD